MPPNRLTIALIGAGAGLLAGALAWLVASAPTQARRLDHAEARLAAASLRRSTVGAEADLSGQALSAPLFTLTTGPGAVAESTVRLQGISQSNGRAAALLAIGDKPADWLGLGETRDGVTLSQVLRSKVVVDTPTGFKEVALGAVPAASEPAAPDARHP